MLTEAMAELNNSEAASEVAITDTALVEEIEGVQKDEEETRKENSTTKETSAVYAACLAIQPNRILCGVSAQRLKSG